MAKIGHRGQFAMKGTYSWQNESGNYLAYKNHTIHHPEQFSIAVEHGSFIATDKYLEHHLEKKTENRHSGDVLSIKSLEHTQNLYLEHFQAILRTSQWGTNGNHIYMYIIYIYICMFEVFVRR